MAAILMDLSKAFDGLPPFLITAKLTAYGLSKKCCPCSKQLPIRSKTGDKTMCSNR